MYSRQFGIAILQYQLTIREKSKNQILPGKSQKGVTSKDKIIETINTGNIIRESNKKRLIKSKDGKVVIGVKQKGLHG